VASVFTLTIINLSAGTPGINAYME